LIDQIGIGWGNWELGCGEGKGLEAPSITGSTPPGGTNGTKPGRKKIEKADRKLNRAGPVGGTESKIRGGGVKGRRGSLEDTTGEMENC